MKVRFYVEPSGDVMAYFPTEQWGPNDGTFTCYAHIGQHSACRPEYLKECRKAKPAEYSELLAELVSIGYDNLKTA